MSWMNGSKNKDDIKSKNDREILEDIVKLLTNFDERLEALESAILDVSLASEVKELKEERKTQNAFMQSIVLSLIEGKKAADAKPSAAELYMQKKAAEAPALSVKEKLRLDNGGAKLPG